MLEIKDEVGRLLGERAMDILQSIHDQMEMLEQAVNKLSQEQRTQAAEISDLWDTTTRLASPAYVLILEALVEASCKPGMLETARAMSRKAENDTPSK